MSKRQQLQTAYGLSDALLNVPLLPVVSTRAPATNDLKEIGSLWVNKSTNAASILTKIVSNTATWTEFTDQEGDFLEYEATTYDQNPIILFGFDIPPSSAITVYCTLSGARADYSAAVAGFFEHGARRQGGAAAVETGAGAFQFNEDAGGLNPPDALFVVAANAIALAVNGEVGVQWNWKAQVTITTLPL